MSLAIPVCPCCGTAEPTRLGRLPDSEWFAGKHLARPLSGGALYRCEECRLKLRYPLASTETYLALYDNAITTTWVGTITRPDWDLIISQVDTMKPNGGRVLDFGCYSGGLLSQLGTRYERFGIEVNRDAANVARERTGARVWHAIEDVPDNLRFDVIVIADVIEHLPNPRSLFDLLETRLAEGGIVVVSTGDAENPLWKRFGANWWYCFYPEHIAFVSQAWVERALCSRGWSLLHCQRFRYRSLSPISRFIERVLASVYGRLPRTYLCTVSILKHWLGRGAVTSVAGNGASADHILFVVNRRPSL